VNDPYVVDEKLNLFTPEKKLVSDSSVDEAAPDSEVKNPASLLNHDRFTDEEAIVCTNPFVPVYVNPCVRDGRYREDPNVDDAVENIPFVNPIVVEVDTYPDTVDVNGNAEDDADRHVPLIAKQPFVRLNPTLDVEVAWPLIFKPSTVVVPKPEPEIVRADVDVVAVPAIVVVDRNRSPPAFRNAHCAIFPPVERTS
jgi:hypothetical protein